jgi:hypothetical protein
MKYSKRTLIKLGIFSGLSVIGLKFTPKTIASNDEIIATFDNYRNALLNTDSDRAYQAIDSNTKKYYQDILKTVLSGKAEQVKQMSFLDKVFIIRSRHQIPFEELTAFNEETYFKYAVEKGWIDKNSVAEIELADIVIEGDRATTKIKKNGQIAPFGFTFRRENNQWKLDFTSIFPVSQTAFQQAIEESGMSEDEFVFYLVETVSNSKVNDSVWNPILKE